MALSQQNGSDSAISLGDREVPGTVIRDDLLFFRYLPVVISIRWATSIRWRTPVKVKSMLAV
ncbi:MAG: hypothetical protein H7240_03030 [Glaciimonas sp.]|nr:hypothetical protein [Glaciimonas sp.]